MDVSFHKTIFFEIVEMLKEKGPAPEVGNKTCLDMVPLFNMIRLSISLFNRSPLKGCLGAWSRGCAGVVAPHSSYYPVFHFYWNEGHLSGAPIGPFRAE